MVSLYVGSHPERPLNSDQSLKLGKHLGMITADQVTFSIHLGQEI